MAEKNPSDHEKKTPVSTSGSTVFCCKCSSKIRSTSQYCWNCQADQSQVGPPEWSVQPCSSGTRCPTSSSASDSNKKLSFGRPVSQDKPKLMSLEEYMKSKSKEQISGHTFRPSKKRKVGDNANEMVTINIGLMKFVGDDLKPVWGKRLPIVVAKTSNYHTILEKAIEKQKAFNRKFDTAKEHVLVYEDGSHAQLMPGGKSFFQLDNYKAEVGKDFKRIILYLCTTEDLNRSEEVTYSKCESPSSPEGVFNNEDLPDELQNQICSDEKVARELQNQLDSDAQLSPDDVVHVSEEESPLPTLGETLRKPEDVIVKLRSEVDNDSIDNFFLVIRRGISLSRLLALWQRQEKRTPVTKVVRIRIIGENGIDSGAIAKEFLETSIRNIEQVMFPDGFPVDSTLHVQNGYYHTAGEISAVSLAQGGPIPCFLHQAAFDIMVNGIDIHNIKDSDLSENEQNLIREIESSCENKRDTIIEHGYTGPVNQDYIKEIVGSVKVSLVNRRVLYMEEFLGGMRAYGLDELIKNHPEACEPLFVDGDFKKSLVPDANYLLSIIYPVYSEEGSSRKQIEDKMIDFFQDTLLSFEDGRAAGYTSAVAWNYTDQLDELPAGQSEVNTNSVAPAENLETPDLSIPGIMQWLTGQRHKPIRREKFGISVFFDHDCMQRNPQHQVCFPRVGACAKEITLPSHHMQTEEEFKKLFILAYCKGQAFANP